jgi:hypothetical protein
MDPVKGGIPASTRVHTVAADGETMTETVSHAVGTAFPMMRPNFDSSALAGRAKQGSPLVRVYFFESRLWS